MQTQTDNPTQTERQIDGQTDKHDRHTNKQADGCRQTQTDRQADRRADRQASRQTQAQTQTDRPSRETSTRQASTQIDRPARRQANRHKSNLIDKGQQPDRRRQRQARAHSTDRPRQTVRETRRNRTPTWRQNDVSEDGPRQTD